MTLKGSSCLCAQKLLLARLGDRIGCQGSKAASTLPTILLLLPITIYFLRYMGASFGTSIGHLKFAFVNFGLGNLGLELSSKIERVGIMIRLETRMEYRLPFRK